MTFVDNIVLGGDVWSSASMLHFYSILFYPNSAIITRLKNRLASATSKSVIRIQNHYGRIADINVLTFRVATTEIIHQYISTSWDTNI